MKPFDRFLLFAAFLCLCPRLADAQDRITVAMRMDAPPFSALSDGAAPDRIESYRGFAAELCRALMKRIAAGAEVTAVPVTVESRFTALDSGQADLACGPISITGERLAKYAYSFPFFLSGISYAVSNKRGAVSSSGITVGMLSRTTAPKGLKALQLRDIFGDYSEAISREMQSPDKGERKHLKFVASYDDGFSRLCEGRLVYLLGDIDILTEMAGHFEHCDIAVARRTITREIYGIPFSRTFFRRQIGETTGQEIFLAFQRELFAFFQSPALNDLFDRNFPDREMSFELRGFFHSYRRDIR